MELNVINDISVLLQKTYATLQDKREQLNSKIREKQEDTKILQELLLRASEANAENMRATIAGSEREISLIVAKLDANEKIFADLGTTLKHCIEAADKKIGS